MKPSDVNANNNVSMKVMRHLQSVIDPEAGISIVDMGLIYEVQIEEDCVLIKMTMTSAACPAGDMLIDEIEACLRQRFPPPAKIDVQITFDPPWNPSMMSDAAKAKFGW